jgi:hypothetical protein
MTQRHPVMSHASTAFARALRGLQPTREQTSLLTACLRDDGSSAHAWDDFVAAVGDPKLFFEADQRGLKALLPFVETRLAANGIDAGKAFHTYARVALVREELRSKIYGEILDTVLGAFAAADISPVLVKGGALSATVYPQPSSRHNHAIDLLVNPADMAAARLALAKAQFEVQPPGYGAAVHQDFRHWTGLALGLHSKALFLPHFDMALDDMRARTRVVLIGSRSVRVMAPEDTLVHICGHAAYSRSRANLRWICDAYYLLQRNPTLCWSVVTDAAARSRTALPLLVSLEWLSSVLDAPVAGQALADLRHLNRRADAITVEGLYAALLHATMSRGTVLELLGSSAVAQLGFLKFSVIPSPRYIRWRHNVEERGQLAFHYIDRLRRFALRLAGRTPGEVRGNDAKRISTRETAA